jgi:chorismate mutase/prephenate dehydratase
LSDAVLSDARVAIDAADRELLALVNRRLELVRSLHEHKLAAGLPLRDPGREEAMIAGLQDANAGPLSADGVESLFRFVLELIRGEIHGP